MDRNWDDPMTGSEFTERVQCPICDGSEYTVLQKAHYPKNLSLQTIVEIFKSSSDTELFDQLVRCNGCGLVYLNPRIREDIIIQAYSEVEDLRFASQNVFRIKTFYKSFRKWLAKFRIPAEKRIKVLDVGCAAGAFPKAVNEIGLSVVGVEPSRCLSEFARREYNLDIRSGVLQDQNFSDKEFDIITLWDVIEHISNPSEILNEIGRILNDSGYLLVNYPEYDSWPRKLLGMKWPFFLNVHLFYFTPKTIRNFLKKNGYHVLKMEPYWQTLELGYVLDRASRVFPLFGMIRKMVGWVGLQKIPVTYYIGQTLVTAQKQKT